MHATTDDAEAVDVRCYLAHGRSNSSVPLWDCQVSIVSTRPNFGGLRYWFVCPVCSRRCATLYRLKHRNGAACRVCLKLNYPSQHERALDRNLRRCSKLRQRLGWPPGVANGEGGRPPGMHRSTFTTLTAEHRRLAIKVNASVSAVLGQLRSSRTRSGSCCAAE